MDLNANQLPQLSLPPHNSTSISHECVLCRDGKQYKGRRGLAIHMGRRHPLPDDVSAQVFVSPSGQPSSNLHNDNNSTSFCNLISKLKCNIKIIKRIPRGARISVANSLSNCISEVLKENSLQSWKNLLTFAFSVLHVKNINSNVSLTSQIKLNTTDILIPDIKNKIKNSSIPSKSKLIENKISDGDVGGAAKILFSEDTFAVNTDSIITSLREKHPLPYSFSLMPSPPSDTQPNLNVLETDVFNILSTFPNGSAGGLDGITPQHLKDLLSSQTGDAGRQLLTNLTLLINHMLAGKVHDDIVPILYGANLIALNKKDGGIRPIAVGSIFRRLSSKLCCKAYHSKLTSKFLPQQFGYGIKGGCEAAVHAARLFLKSTDYQVFIKIDIKNAFNTLDRGVMLSEVKNYVPEIFNYLWQCYGTSSKLMFRDIDINSHVGCQQGDPLGPALFSLAIQPIISKLNSKFNLWYLDDGTLGGNADTVFEDLKEIISKFSDLGLSLNFNKCEIYISDVIPLSQRLDIITKFNKIAPNVSVINKDCLFLLGAPIFNESISNFIKTKLNIFNHISEHLLKIKSHMALFIIRHCLFTPKFTYLLRSCPMWKFPSLTLEIDQKLKNILSHILNIKFNDRSFSQATLPINFGGLGIRLTTSVALPAFLASAHSARSHIGNILKLNTNEVRVCYLEEAIEAWSTAYPTEVFPSDTTIQKIWDAPGIKNVYNKLFLESILDADRARLLAVKEKESGYWLHALPSSHVGTLLDNSSLSIAVGLRLGIRMCEPHQCSCGRGVDTSGHHGLSCVKSAGRFYRHSSLNELIKRALTTVSIPALLEPPGMLRDDGKRPDGVTIVPWSLGRTLVWDATCVDTLAASYLQETVQRAGAAAEQAQIRKRRKYSTLATDHIFAAFAVETLGPWSSDAKKFFKEIGTRLVHASSDPRAAAFFAQQVSLTIQRGNAASILGTYPRNTGLESVFFL